MTQEERERVGRELRALRVKKDLHQRDAAKKVKMAVGTLQAIEGAWYDVTHENVEKLARFYGTSLRKLLQTEQIQPNNPLLAELNEEHLQIARAYMRARRKVREGVEAMLSDGLDETALALAVRIQKLDTETQSALAALISSAEVADSKRALAAIEHARTEIVSKPTVVPVVK